MRTDEDMMICDDAVAENDCGIAQWVAVCRSSQRHILALNE